MRLLFMCQENVQNLFFSCGVRKHFFYFLALRFDGYFCDRIHLLWR